MKLMTPELERRFAEIGKQESVKDPVIITRFCDPVFGGTLYAAEYNPASREIFGYLCRFCDEDDRWDYYSLQALESYVSPNGTGIVRDLYWMERKASTFIPYLR